MTTTLPASSLDCWLLVGICCLLSLWQPTGILQKRLNDIDRIIYYISMKSTYSISCVEACKMTRWHIRDVNGGDILRSSVQWSVWYLNVSPPKIPDNDGDPQCLLFPLLYLQHSQDTRGSRPCEAKTCHSSSVMCYSYTTITCKHEILWYVICDIYQRPGQFDDVQVTISHVERNVKKNMQSGLDWHVVTNWSVISFSPAEMN